DQEDLSLVLRHRLRFAVERVHREVVEGRRLVHGRGGGKRDDGGAEDRELHERSPWATGDRGLCLMPALRSKPPARMAARRRDGIRIRAKPSQVEVVPTSNAKVES